MINRINRYAPTPNFQEWFHFALKWTPRTIVACLSGYYSLGVAYEMGIMAAIDRIAIRILRHSLGYMGMAAMMPTFQWYSAWAVRISAAIAAGFIYDLIERVFKIAFASFFKPNEASSQLFQPAPFYHPRNL